MVQGAVEASGPLWGWDGDGDDDWDGAVLALLALAVVATTALAFQWFGSRQDQEVTGSTSTSPGMQPTQAGGPRMALHPKSKVSDASKGQSSGRWKSEAPGHLQGKPATARAQDPEPSRGGSMASTARLPLKTPGEVASRGATPGALGNKGREPPRQETALMGYSKARDTPAPLLIHFTSPGPDSKAETQVEASGTQNKGTTCQVLVHTKQQDKSPWHLSVRPSGSLGRGLGSLRRRPGTSSGDRPCRPRKPDPLRLGSAVSVWDTVDTACAATQDTLTCSSLAGTSLLHLSRGLRGPQEISPASFAHTCPQADDFQDVHGRSGLQLTSASTAGPGAKDGQSRETGSPTPKENREVLACEEAWHWESGAAMLTSNFRCSRGALLEESPLEASEVDHVMDQSKTEKLEGHLTGEGRGAPQSQSSEQMSGSPSADQRLVLSLETRKSSIGGLSCTPSCNPPASPLMQDTEQFPSSMAAAHHHPVFLHAVPTPAPLNSLPLGPPLYQGPPDGANLRVAPAPFPTPILAPGISTSASAAILAPSPISSLISCSDPELFTSLTPISKKTPAVVPVSTSTSKPTLDPEPDPVVVLTPISKPTPASVSITVLTPISTPTLSPASVPITVLTTVSTPTSSPTQASTPVESHASAVASGSRPVSRESNVGLSKSSQEGQISTNWGNLITMVLRSHPFPKEERPQGSAPKEVPASPAGLGTSTHPEDRQPGFHSEEAICSLQDKHLVTSSSSGDLVEAACQLQPMSMETKESFTSGSPLDPRDESKEKSLDLLPLTAKPRAASQLSVQAQPGPVSSTAVRKDSQPIPQPPQRQGQHSVYEEAQSSEQTVTQEVPQQPQQVPGEEANPAGSRAEQQKEAQKIVIFLQKPGSWGVVEGPQKSCSLALQPTTTMGLWPQRLDLGSCLEVLAFAQQHGELDLARETYALISNNLLHVLGDPHLYRQLSGADRERILSLRTCQGQTVLGVLVLPSLYQMSRSGITRSSHDEEAPASRPEHLYSHTYLHVFNPQENVWWPLTQIPEEIPLRGCGLCTMYNYLFLAGGIRGSGTKAVCSNKVFCYNPLTNIWSQIRPMQQARAQLKLVALDGQLYAIGGECLYSMERYDPRTDSWTLRASLPEGTFPVAHEAVACRGDIYVTGGHLFYRLLRYSPKKDSWDECPYSASHRRSSDMVALGGFLYRFDLLRGVGAAVMRYNTVTGSWSHAASLPLPNPAPLHCTVLGNTIYCLNHQVTATFTVSEGTAQFQAKELQPFPLGSKGVLCPFTLTLPPKTQLQTTL
ncbi:kelch domain-containing protein 7B [Nannospalax galili]|uniref:kelch domain-containing protein 7B n=1 Tax=Nannospalax galili TaxID=1026970 RepID=UPI00111BDD89|nr:kelch domain-containing protein 7B [Nannospalax galili]